MLMLSIWEVCSEREIPLSMVESTISWGIKIPLLPHVSTFQKGDKNMY